MRAGVDQFKVGFESFYLFLGVGISFFVLPLTAWPEPAHVDPNVRQKGAEGKYLLQSRLAAFPVAGKAA